MPKVQRIFEQDNEVCVSLGKIGGEGNLVFLTEEERQKMLRDEKNYWLDEAIALMPSDGAGWGWKSAVEDYQEKIRQLKERL